MEYIYSAMLLHSAGKEINEKNIKKILTAAGVDADDARIKALTASRALICVSFIHSCGSPGAIGKQATSISLNASPICAK